MTSDAPQPIDALASPGALLKEAREAQDMTEREAADRLNLMPNYVGILERNDYQSLRSPAFARGYVRAYGKLLGVNEPELLALFDAQLAQEPLKKLERIETRPLQLQRTGMGVVVGLSVLVLLIAVLWWWQGGRQESLAPPLESDGELSSSGQVWE